MQDKGSIFNLYSTVRYQSGDLVTHKQTKDLIVYESSNDERELNLAPDDSVDYMLTVGWLV